jgi:hypothetical protein
MTTNLVIMVYGDVYDVIESGISKEFEEEVKIVYNKGELEKFIEGLDDEDRKTFFKINASTLKYIKCKDRFLGIIYPIELFFFVNGDVGTVIYYD